MATVVKTTTETASVGPVLGLRPMAFLAAGYVIAAAIAVLYGIPMLWASAAEPLLGNLEFVSVALRLTAQVAATIALVVVGKGFLGLDAPVGLRGGMFVVITTLFLFLFLGRAAVFIGIRNIDGIGGQVVGGLLFAVVSFFLVRFVLSERFTNLMISLEEQGWFHAKGFKRTQGLRVRRMTMLGVFLVLGSGIYSLSESSYLITLPKDWELTLPFVDFKLPLLPDVKYTLPLLLAAAGGWFTYRLVNHPRFADFLIATEAEMNKVSWSTRKQLVRDTIVVLTTVFIFTVFLFAVDYFWGWVLSREAVGVLPSQSVITKDAAEKKAKASQDLPY